MIKRIIYLAIIIGLIWLLLHNLRTMNRLYESQAKMLNMMAKTHRQTVDELKKNREAIYTWIINEDMPGSREKISE